MALLEIDDLSLNFGGLKALDGAEMHVQAGEIRGLIGPNGSGKSTFLNVISRIYTPSRGSIFLNGTDLLKRKAHDMPQLGVVRTFQNLELFNNLTVLQNLMISQTCYQTYNILSAALVTRHFRRLERACYENAMELLKLVGLEKYEKRMAHDLSFGQQKLLELARALVVRPKLLMLDEPAAGLSPVMVKRLVDILNHFRQESDLAVIVVEHMTKLVMEIADRITILHYGRVLAEGTPEQILTNQKVIDVYLGRGIKEAFEGKPGPERKTVSLGEPLKSEVSSANCPSVREAFAPLHGKEEPDCFKGLKVQSIDAFYGKLQSLYGLSLKVPQGEIIALLGGNGSGKSTTINAISGLVDIKSGTIEYNGSPLPRKNPHKIVKMGIVQVPQHREVFPYLNVKENLAMGAYRRHDRNGIEGDYERVYSYFPRLKERRKQLAASMSGGEQQMLAIGRALMSNPDMLLLDEPSASLAPTLVEEIFEKLLEINKDGTTLFIVEQNIDAALSVALYVYILRQGEIVCEDWAHNLRDNNKIISSYFGGSCQRA